MKKLLLGLILLTSISSFAAKECKIKGVGTVFTTDGDIFYEENADIIFRKKVETWEDCYKLALEKSKNYIESSNGTVSSLFMEETDVKIYISFTWEFQDGLISLLNTSGKITKFTDKYENTPYDGDMRYFSDGRTFK